MGQGDGTGVSFSGCVRWVGASFALPKIRCLVSLNKTKTSIKDHSMIALLLQ